MIRLTTLDGNRIAHPVSINPTHVVSVRPRKQISPVDAQQQPNATFVFKGAVVQLVTGERLNVLEDHDEVDRRLTPPPVPAPLTPAEVEKVMKKPLKAAEEQSA